MLDELVQELGHVGLVLNADKTKVLTTMAQAPDHLVTDAGVCMDIIPRGSAHKYLGSMLAPFDGHSLDVEHRLQAATKAFYAHKASLTDRSVPVNLRLRFFDVVVSPVACYAACQRNIYQDDLHQLDIVFRRLARQVVGPPGGLDWSQPWHDLLHSWHERLATLTSDCDVETWSAKSLRQHWRFAAYLATLPSNRWAHRVLRWMPDGSRTHGRPRNRRQDKIVAFCARNRLGDWTVAAKDERAWKELTDDFLAFVV